MVTSQEQFAQPPFLSYINQETSSSVEATQQFLESITKACGVSGAHGGLPAAGAVPVPGWAASPRVPLLSAGSPQATMAGSPGVGVHPGQGADVTASQLSASTVQTSQKEAELEGACKNLQKQVRMQTLLCMKFCPFYLILIYAVVQRPSLHVFFLILGCRTARCAWFHVKLHFPGRNNLSRTRGW